MAVCCPQLREKEKVRARDCTGGPQGPRRAVVCSPSPARCCGMTGSPVLTPEAAATHRHAWHLHDQTQRSVWVTRCSCSGPRYPYPYPCAAAAHGCRHQLGRVCLAVGVRQKAARPIPIQLRVAWCGLLSAPSCQPRARTARIRTSALQTLSMSSQCFCTLSLDVLLPRPPSPGRARVKKAMLRTRSKTPWLCRKRRGKKETAPSYVGSSIHPLSSPSRVHLSLNSLPTYSPPLLPKHAPICGFPSHPLP